MPPKRRHPQLSEVLRQLLAYRGWRTPELLDASYKPDKAPVGGTVLRRIIDGDREPQELELLRLAGMLRVPPRALILVDAADTDGLSKLNWQREPEVGEFIIEIIREMNDPPRNRRASDRRRA